MSTKTYVCADCGEELEMGRVSTVSLPHAAAAGLITLTYVCECSPEASLVKTYRYDRNSLRALTGQIKPEWESSFTPTLVRDDDPLLVHWRWEVEQLASADELLLWIDLHNN